MHVCHAGHKNVLLYGNSVQAYNVYIYLEENPVCLSRPDDMYVMCTVSEGELLPVYTQVANWLTSEIVFTDNLEERSALVSRLVDVMLVSG